MKHSFQKNAWLLLGSGLALSAPGFPKAQAEDLHAVPPSVQRLLERGSLLVPDSDVRILDPNMDFEGGTPSKEEQYWGVEEFRSSEWGVDTYGVRARFASMAPDGSCSLNRYTLPNLRLVSATNKEADRAIRDIEIKAMEYKAQPKKMLTQDWGPVPTKSDCNVSFIPMRGAQQLTLQGGRPPAPMG